MLAVLCLLPLAALSGPAAPTLKVTSPPNGAILTNHTVNITGLAGGSDFNWKQGSKTEFGTGTRTGLDYNATGAMFLDRTLIEDFDDNSFDTTKWSRSNAGGITTTEVNKGLRHNGRNTASGYWNGWSRVTSTAAVPNIVSADLTSFGGSGTGYSTMIALYQDDSNWIGIGLAVDTSAYGAGTWVVYSYASGGSLTGATLRKVTAGSHNYMVKCSGGTAYLYEDQFEAAKTTLTLSSPKVRFAGSTRALSDTIDAT